MSKVTDQIMQDAGFSIPARLRPSAAEAHPPLPTVGRVVHFYHSKCSPVGPYAAIVHQVRVDVIAGTNPPKELITAEVDLNVSIGGALTESYKLEGPYPPYAPWKIFIDVPGIIPGVDHQHEYWWQWPERS